MKEKSKNKLTVALLGVILILIITLLVLFFIKKNKEQIKDSVKFAKEYTEVEKDNLFVYSNSEDIIRILEHGSGVVYLGFPECPWCQEYVSILNDIAKEEEIEKIHYYNILEDRKNNTEVYQKMINLLSGNLLYDDEGKERVYVPDISIVKNGTIIGHDNTTSVVTESDGTPKEYWTNERKLLLSNKLKSYFKELNSNICTSCDN